MKIMLSPGEEFQIFTGDTQLIVKCWERSNNPEDWHKGDEVTDIFIGTLSEDREFIVEDLGVKFPALANRKMQVLVRYVEVVNGES